MAGESLRVRFQKGDVVVELEGDAAVVNTELASLVTYGLGHLLDFFHGIVAPSGDGEPQPQPDRPRPGAALTPLTSVARSLQFAVDSVALPRARTDHSVDLDGDGAPDNHFGAIVSALAAQGVDLQSWVDASLSHPARVLLLRVDTEHEDLSRDQRVDVTVTIGTGNPMGGAVSIDPSASTTTLCGFLTSGRFASQDPLEGGAVTFLQMPVQLSPSASSALTLHVVTVGFALASDGSKLTSGRVSGSAEPNDFATFLSSSLAEQLSAILASEPESERARTIAAVFDTGNCTNPDGTLAEAGDGVIDICEVVSNPLIRAVLAPDIRLHDAAGNYAPSTRSPKDSVSVGIGFTARPASFDHRSP